MAEGGTLCQLKCLIKRTNIPAKPKDNVNAAEKFFQVVVIGHIISAALHHFNMDSVEDIPSSVEFTQICSETSVTSQAVLFHAALLNMAKTFFNITSFDNTERKIKLEHMLKRFFL